MLSETWEFDDIPRYILSDDARLRKIAVSMLKQELDAGARRPWSAIEPFIVALYHSVFVLEDYEASRLLLEYISKVYNRYKHYLSREAQEIIEIVSEAVKAKLGQTIKEYALQTIRNIATSTILSNLVKTIAITELTGEYSPEINRILIKISDHHGEKASYFRELLSEPDAREIVQHYLVELDQDKVLISEGLGGLPSFFQYFVQRAKQLQEEFEIRKKIVSLIEHEYENLTQEYNAYYDSLLNKIRNILTATLVLGSITSIFLGLLYNIILSYIGGTILIAFFVASTIRQLADIVRPYVGGIASLMASLTIRLTPSGRSLRKKIKHKKIALNELKSKIRKLR